MSKRFYGSVVLSAACIIAIGACGSSDDSTGSHSGGSSGTGAVAGAGGTGGKGGGGSGGTSTGGAGGTGGSGGSAGAAGTGASGGSGGSAGAGATCAVLAKGPNDSEQTVPGFAARAFDLHVPPSYDCAKPFPVVLALHGGGGNKHAASVVTCPGDDPKNPPTNLNGPGCLNAAADQKGFVIVYPDGTKSPLLPNQEIRTFNAGGGSKGYNCTSGYACSQNVDEIAYFTALLDRIATIVNVDPKRIFVTGLSNGGAMSHKLACLMANRIAAIAPISGGNQYATLQTCAPSRPVPVLHIHGDADTCWPFLGGPTNCAATGNMVGIPASPSVVIGPSTIGDWLTRNGCGTTPTGENLPDLVAGDGTVHADHYTGCTAGADVDLYTIAGGGHFWPGGFSYNGNVVGFKNRDINASEIILDFFAKHPMP